MNLYCKSILILISQIIFIGLIEGQEVITLANPSFEGLAHSGDGRNGNAIPGWRDCGPYRFPNETPPDLHNSIDPNDYVDNEHKYFGVTKLASDGRTFLGMVARDNDSHESVSQRLEAPLRGGQCYTFSIELSRSKVYISPYPETNNSKSYTQPIVMRIYGGSNYCDRRQLLAESPKIENTDWQQYDFTFKPDRDYRFITIEAFYKVPIMLSYNGNLLLDNASTIVETLCPEDQPIADVEIEEEPEEKPDVKPKNTIKNDPIATQTKPIEREKPTRTLPDFEKPKINTELDRQEIVKGQVVNIKNLFFEADKSDIDQKSHESLDELVKFLKNYDDVRVEIGGHTNARQPHEWCDSLSTLRAKAVAEYLFEQGVPKSQVEYKGYGKRKPIASNKTLEGRNRNQRVEIKILEFDS